MEIRKARVTDAAAIAAIAEAVRYREGDADASRGYLVFVGTAAEYASRLSANATSYVAEQDGKVLAFLLTTATAGNTATHADSDAVQRLLFGGDALLVDQIAVHPEARGTGAATLLYERMRAEVAPQRMTASIMHGPLKNKRSSGFFAGKQGWKCVGEYHEGFGFLWGVYEWKADGGQGDARYPLGRFLYGGAANELDLAARLERIRILPEQLRAVLKHFDEDALDAQARPGAWTPRQIVHHMADAHGQLGGRARLILTEERPLVKTFEENLWAELADAKTAPVEESLRILEGLHARLARLIASRPHDEMLRYMIHPDQGLVTLDRVLAYLDWHGRHHTAQIG